MKCVCACVVKRLQALAAAVPAVHVIHWRWHTQFRLAHQSTCNTSHSHCGRKCDARCLRRDHSKIIKSENKKHVCPAFWGLVWFLLHTPLQMLIFLCYRRWASVNFGEYWCMLWLRGFYPHLNVKAWAVSPSKTMPIRRLWSSSRILMRRLISLLLLWFIGLGEGFFSPLFTFTDWIALCSRNDTWEFLNQAIFPFRDQRVSMCEPVALHWINKH